MTLASQSRKHYSIDMTKAHLKREPAGKLAVRDAQSGRFLEVRGANAMRDAKLPLKKGIDLTKPIARQAAGGTRSGK